MLSETEEYMQRFNSGYPHVKQYRPGDLSGQEKFAEWLKKQLEPTEAKQERFIKFIEEQNQRIKADAARAEKEKIDSQRKKVTMVNLQKLAGDVNAAVHNVKRGGFVLASFSSEAGFSTSAMPAIHETKDIARTEAKRLAKANPNKLFIILEIAGGELVPNAEISI